MFFFTKNPNLKSKQTNKNFGWGWGVLWGEGAGVSDFFYKESKPKNIFFLGGGGGGRGVAGLE